jgi:hypothetical protein
MKAYLCITIALLLYACGSTPNDKCVIREAHEGDTIVCPDGVSILHRNQHGMPTNITSVNGKPCNIERKAHGVILYCGQWPIDVDYTPVE